MKNLLLLALFCFFIISCASKDKMTGTYKINFNKDNDYIFDMDNQSYTSVYKSGSIAKGKFKVVRLSSERILLVCNDLIFKNGHDYIKDINEKEDSVYIGVEHWYKNLGSTVFEINKKDTENLKYRKTYGNQIEKTEETGILIRIK